MRSDPSHLVTEPFRINSGWTCQQRQEYTGKERDSETGLDYFGARYFGSAQGSFTSPDWSATPQPVPSADLKDPQSLNLYAYVRNNPLTNRDPDGHWCHFGAGTVPLLHSSHILRQSKARGGPWLRFRQRDEGVPRRPGGLPHQATARAFNLSQADTPHAQIHHSELALRFRGRVMTAWLTGIAATLIEF